ncbi:MAG: hypothetical protein HC902_14220 [Calothrix sp. SM1_5_4]|nr:hypothetical protein [Calothrix sp. SM1_5_4]
MMAKRLLIVFALGLAGCSAAKFTTNKDAALSKSVFGEEPNGAAGQSISPVVRPTETAS